MRLLFLSLRYLRVLFLYSSFITIINASRYRYIITFNRLIFPSISRAWTSRSRRVRCYVHYVACNLQTGRHTSAR